MKQYMLIFSLGSVQAYIEQARKTRDLWLGSFLIAKLMEAAMQEVEKAQSEEPFIFPTHRTLNQRHATLPHKYVAIFNTLSNAQAAVEQSKRGMKEFWNTLRQDVWQAIIPQTYKADETLKHLWDEQSELNTCFETFWVIVEGNSESYSTWLNLAENALESRKRLKDFQFRTEPGEKSSISGERQALHSHHQTTRDQVKKFWEQIAKDSSLSTKEISKDGSERLDAPDTIKRFASRSRIIELPAFPSTSSIATATFVERLLNVETAQLDAWLTATNQLAEMHPEAIPYLQRRAREDSRILKRDGDCYFKETFTARHLQKDYDFPESNAADIAERARVGLSVLFAVTDKLSIRRPTPYYAIVKMDGDRMQKLLSRVNRDEHQQFSKALSSFSRIDAPRLIQDEYPGRLVYAGGDDVLALVPLARDISEAERKKSGAIHTLLHLVDQLQQRFGGIQAGVSDHHEKVTASVGIAIAHHYTPLSAVLRVTREAERLAKDRYDRNALVVTIVRRSGEQTSVGCHWEYEGLATAAQPVPLFSEFYNLFDLDVLSPKCVYTLLEEAPALVTLDLDEPAKLSAQTSEFKRVLRRQRDEKKINLLPDETVTSLARHLVDLAYAMDREMDEQHKGEEDFEKSLYLHEDKPRYGLVETLGWLLVMAFLTRKEQD